MAAAGAALLAWTVKVVIWSRDVMLPQQIARLAHAAAVGRVAARAGLESLREGSPDATPGRVIDISVLVSALSIGWYGPIRPASTVEAEEEDEDESHQTGRLAS
jgi:hypothetical protein